MSEESTFITVALVLLVAAAVGAVASRLRQPLIVAFIAAGVLVGPAALGWVEESSGVVILAELGIAVLLFLVGLKLDVQLIRTTGAVAVVTGLGQVVFTSLIGYWIGILLGLAPLPAVYVAVALTFSSTIIIVKLLSDKRELDTLHGRIAVGFLIVQDIVVVLAMIALTAFAAEDGRPLGLSIALVVVKGVLFLGSVAVASRWVLPRLFGGLAGSHELLVLAALAWAVALAALGDVLGFSREVGAFLGGVSLASTPYREAIGSRLVTLRDFLLLFFFIDLGSRLDLAGTGYQIGPALVLSAFVLIGNPFIVMVLMGIMGYRKRVGFLAGLTVAQISEFSLILAALGLTLGHIDVDTVGLITLVGLITIGLSTYLIIYSHPLYRVLADRLTIFERRHHLRTETTQPPRTADVVVFGGGRHGGRLAHQLREAGHHVLVVDHNPAALTALHEGDVDVLYGDAEEPELIRELPLRDARCVVSTIPDRGVATALLHSLRAAGYDGPVVVTASTEMDAELLDAAGAHHVLQPHAVAARDSLALVLRNLERKGFREDGGGADS
ncbi:cation:proton antiporter [Georgenia sp. AZ-5]|uniref:cation:proton antiporter n=1 Tax=Georgenia sp. AZ-5 TaxID=3367526 RepID=UPI003754EC51